MFQKLNKDQLNGLANLCFDLAKVGFGLSILPTPELMTNIPLGIFRIILSILTGLAFTHLALVFLGYKERVSK